MAPARPHQRIFICIRWLCLTWVIAASLCCFVQPAWAQDSGGYTVVPGDTLGAIASRFGVSLDNLIAANGISDPNRLSVGQVLVIPGADGVAVAAAAPEIDAATVSLEGIITADVRALPGDTATAVARRYSQDPILIARLNNTGEAARFFPGQPIAVPAQVIAAPTQRFGAITAVEVPETLVQGFTGHVAVDTSRAVSLTGTWLGQPLVFTPITPDGLRQFALLPVSALQDPGVFDLVLGYTTARGAPVAQSWKVVVEDGGYESQEIVVSEETAATMTP
jgi:murein DD-endopeptidase MepM/ murein hydrolase activator NlpD